MMESPFDEHGRALNNSSIGQFEDPQNPFNLKVSVVGKKGNFKIAKGNSHRYILNKKGRGKNNMSNPQGFSKDLIMIESSSVKKVNKNELNSNLYNDKHIKIKSPKVTNIQIALDDVEIP